MESKGSNAYSSKRINWGSFSKPLSRDAEPYEDLSAFGYTAKIYYDSEKYAWIQSNRHLIPWMGHEELLIDRYDARGYLNDLSQYDSKFSKQPNAHELTDEELEQERLLNIERFADLNDEDESEKEAASNDAVSGGEYSNVGYHYENSESRAVKENGHAIKEESKGDDTFKAPCGLNILPNLILPETNKHHYIIEKTALFVAQQGSQMEILLKTKQASNSSFDFLSIDSPLNQYYKFLLNEIKTGKYTPKGSNGQADENDSENDSDDGNYLHPSLLSSKSQNTNNKVKIGHLTNVFNSKSSEDDSYSQLVKHFKDKFADDIDESSSSEKSPNNESDSSKAPSNSKSVSSLIPQPPSDVEAIIVKLAEHVGKNGDEFEKSIKALGDKKFQFLNPGHIYHPFYVKLKISEIAKHRKPKKHDPSRTIAFSIAAKEPPKKVNQNTTITRALKEGAQRLAKPQNEQAPLLTKEQKLQLERKKKAMEFINMLRKENSISTESIPYGPDMPKDNIQLSPTIEAITSPAHSPTRKFAEKITSTTDSVLPFTTDDALIKNRPLSPFHRRRNTTSLSPPQRYKLDNDDELSPDRTPARYRRSSSRKRRHRSRSRSRSRSKDRKRRHKRSHKSSHRSSRRSRSKSRSRSPDARKSDSPRKDDRHRTKKRRHESSSHRKNRRSQSPS